MQTECRLVAPGTELSLAPLIGELLDRFVSPARAFENMLALATCNYPRGQPDCNGRSTLFDGVAYAPGEDASRDTCVLEAPGEAGIYLAQLDLDALRAYRAAEVHGNAYRRPELYGALCSRKVREPFIRPDRRA